MLVYVILAAPKQVKKWQVVFAMGFISLSAKEWVTVTLQAEMKL